MRNLKQSEVSLNLGFVEGTDDMLKLSNIKDMLTVHIIQYGRKHPT